MDSGVLPRLTCVKQACELCGLDKVLVCRRKEERNAKLREGKVRLMMSGKKAYPGYEEKTKIEPTSVKKSLEAPPIPNP